MGLHLLQGGHRASSRPTAASFPEQGRERKKAASSRAGGFLAVPTPEPHPLTLRPAPYLPGRRSTHLLSSLGPETSNESKVPPLHGKVGEGEAAEPLPPAAPGSEGLNE